MQRFLVYLWLGAGVTQVMLKNGRKSGSTPGPRVTSESSPGVEGTNRTQSFPGTRLRIRTAKKKGRASIRNVQASGALKRNATG
jgi:hypothetical protein